MLRLHEYNVEDLNARLQKPNEILTWNVLYTKQMLELLEKPALVSTIGLNLLLC